MTLDSLFNQKGDSRMHTEWWIKPELSQDEKAE